LEKAIVIYSTWHSTYPREFNPANALANDSNLLGRYPAAIAAAQDAVRLDPNHSFGYANLAIALMASNRYEEAQQVCDEALAKHRSSSLVQRIQFQLAFLNGDPRHIAAAKALAMRDPDNAFDIGQAAFAQGKVIEATRLFTQAAEEARRGAFPGIAAGDLSGEAILLAEVGEVEQARRLARESISDDAGETGYGQPMIALATVGTEQEVVELERKLDRAFPLSVYNMGLYRPVTEGLMAARRKASPAEVQQAMTPAVPYELGGEADLMPIYFRARLLMERGDGVGAVQEFQRLLDHRGIDPTSPFLSLAHLGLARAHHHLNQARESCTEYREFLHLWKDGDPQVPVLQAARREAATLCPLAH
jgi:tetratricopeptide (TPR) repeat protein